MGIIAAVTPCLKSTTIIQRMQDVPLADLVRLGEIEFQKLIPRQKPKAYFKVLPEVTPSDESQVDYVWAMYMAYYLRSTLSARWQRYIQ